MIGKNDVVVMTGVHELREDLADLYFAFEDLDQTRVVSQAQILRIKIIADRMQWKLNILEDTARKSGATASKIPLARLVMEITNG